VDVYAHLEQQRAAVMRRIEMADSAVSTRAIVRSKGPVTIARGTTLHVRLRLDGCIINQPEDVILWEAEIGLHPSMSSFLQPPMKEFDLDYSRFTWMAGCKSRGFRSISGSRVSLWTLRRSTRRCSGSKELSLLTRTKIEMKCWPAFRECRKWVPDNGGFSRCRQSPRG